MANQKGFTVMKLILFILALAAVALFAYGMLYQPVFKNVTDSRYLEYFKSITDGFPDLLKSTAKDKLFGIVLVGALLALLVMAAIFTGVATLVVFISGMISLFTKRRMKTIWLLWAGAFHLAFISVLMSSFYPLTKPELGLGGIFIVAGVALGVVIYGLEDYFCGDNKSARRFIGTLVRIAISGAFIFISLFCFSEIYRLKSETSGFSQTLFSNSIYLARIEEDLPKKLFAFVAVGTFAIGLVINILVPMLPLICGSRSLSEKISPKNRNKKYIVQSIVMMILLAITYFGTVMIADNPSDYTFGGGLLIMALVFIVSLALSIIMAIVDPRTKIVRPEGNVPPLAPQSSPRASKNEYMNASPKTTDNNPPKDGK